MTDEEVSNLAGDELVSLLASKGFMGLSEEELNKLEEDDLKLLTEEQRLELAQLGDYNPNEYYQLIGEDALLIRDMRFVRLISIRYLEGLFSPKVNTKQFLF